jgi:hypothetical protein
MGNTKTGTNIREYRYRTVLIQPKCNQGGERFLTTSVTNSGTRFFFLIF